MTQVAKLRGTVPKTNTVFVKLNDVVMNLG
jgi:hypothetical protein